MSGNPFDDEDGTFLVLVNSRGQHSLWPSFAEVPGGWEVRYGGPSGTDRRACLDYVDASWQDIRPLDVPVEAHDSVAG
ncbi:MbtH family protein [Pseudonocardia sp. TMWB2A]|uniref:MbtH family protein n=1 Tax=Pseudonocardia sp. TMWB2A TaxID=687430 RepID=UPI00307D59EC